MLLDLDMFHKIELNKNSSIILCLFLTLTLCSAQAIQQILRHTHRGLISEAMSGGVISKYQLLLLCMVFIIII